MLHLSDGLKCLKVLSNKGVTMNDKMEVLLKGTSDAWVCSHADAVTKYIEVTRSAKIPDDSYYLAGPMSNRPAFNFPAFDEASKKLRSEGYLIVSPAELEDE